MSQYRLSGRSALLDPGVVTPSTAFAPNSTSRFLEPALAEFIPCHLYPIALSSNSLTGVAPGGLIGDIYNGTQPGNFGWLTWRGSPSEPALVASLTPPGNGGSYVNPNNALDHEVSVGDWVRGKPGISNSKNVRDALDALKVLDIIVPVWNEVRGQGSNTLYRVAAFAKLRLISYQLPAQNRISARFLSYTDCPIPVNRAPQVNAGPDQTITLPASANLNGIVTDDGLPRGATLTISWTRVSGPGSVTFSNASRPTTTASFSMAGVYVLRLTASDSQLSSSDDVIVTVKPANQPPTVDAGADQTVILPNLAHLNGVATDDGLPVGSSLTTLWSSVSGPGSVTFANPASAATTAIFSTPGPYVLRLTASDSALTNSDELTVTVEAKPFSSRVYTLNADFDEGSAINVVHNVPDQLQLDDTTRAFNFIWVAVSTKGTIVKIDTETGAVLGEYHTAPQGQQINPSRTTVDHNGNVWTANRDGNSVVRVGLLENGQCVDRNGNGVIETSSALGDVRAWPNGDGRDTDGGVETAADECIINYVRVSSSGTRHVSVNADNDVWVSGTGGQIFDLIDGETGLIKRTERSVGYGGYGGLIDKSGVIWSARRLLRWDTSKPLSGVNGDNWLGYEHDSYGLCIDSHGNVWNTQLENSAVRKFAPDGTLVGIFPHGSFYAQGCVVDRNDDVWVAHSINGGRTVGHLKNDGAFLGNVQVGLGPTGVAVDASGKIWATNYHSRTVSRINPAAGPIGADGATPVGEVDFTTVNLGGDLYNYSDMTGSTLTGAPGEGTWTTVFDSGVAGAEWGRIGWTARVCGDGSLTVTVASSEDGTTFGPSEIVTSGADPGVANGRYLKISVSFRRATSGESPVLYDLSVGTQGFPLPAAANAAPEVNAGLDQTISLPNSATLNGSVCDDGLPGGGSLSISWSKVSGPGSVTFSNPNQVKTDAAFSDSGIYVLRLTAGDSERTGNDDVTITVTPPNQAPAVDAGPDQTINLPETASLNGAVTDDGLPVGGTITTLWSKVSGPGNVTFGGPNVTVTTASFSVAGTYVLRLNASDSQLAGADELTVTVNPPNQPPVVNAGSDQTISLPTDTVNLSGTVTDDGLPTGSTIIVKWSKASGPGTVILGNAGQLLTTAKFSTTGTYVLRLTASDSLLASSDDITVVVTEPNQTPVVNAGPDRTITLPQTATLNGTATDDGLPAGSSLTTTWSAISGPGPVTFANMNASVTTASFSTAGVYVLRLTASDSLLSSNDDVSVTVNPQPIPPTVAIHSLSDGNDVTSPIDIVGDVSGGQWVLEYSVNSNSGSANQNWVTFASGNTPVSNGTLGRFDPTVLLNGTYSVRLTATDVAGQISSVSTSVVVDGEQKVGNFSISFNDLSIPVAGLPLQVIRTYDSRDKRNGDFGVGWTLDIRNVRVEKTGLIGRGWQQTRSGGLFPNYCLQPTKPRLVTITFQDGKVYKFRAVTNPQCQLLLPIQFATVGFTPVEGTHGSLSAVGSTDVFYDGSSPGVGDLVNLDDFNPYDPTAFSLTTEDGTVYVIDQHAGVRSMTDTNGNTLTINHDGIIHSSGKSVTFTRDSHGRITQITDPAGHSMSYTYDANSDLVSFGDRENNVSRYTYNATHGLLTILDPRGIQPLRNDYDADGRLIKQTDAFGNVINFTHDLDARREIVRDRLGNPTVYEYDANGNVLRLTDAKGGITTRTYDARDNLLTETNALGKTTTYTYDAQDNRLTETDALGNVTRYTYNSRRQVLTATDPAGGVTTNTYDANGNLLTVRDPLGNVTTSVYSASGLPTSTTDALGNITSSEYDASGNLIKETDPLNNSSTFTYDASGRQTSSVDSLGNANTYAYDNEGRLTRQTNPMGQTLTYTYDANRNKLTETLSYTNALGAVVTQTTSYAYDGLNRLVSTTDPLGHIVTTQYDANGNEVVNVSQEGLRLSHEYDEVGNLIKTTFPDGTFEANTYDANGNQLSATDRAGNVTRYEYAALGQPTRTINPDGSSSRREYDAASRVIAIYDENGNKTTFVYDNAGRRAKVIDALGNETTYAYDANGNRTSVTDANTHITRFEYDGNNNLAKVVFHDGTFVVYGYDTLNRKVAVTDQAGITTRFEYDPASRLTKLTDALNQSTSFAYDGAGNRVAQTDASGRVTRWEYDKARRLTKRVLPLGMSETFAYDPTGNVVSKTDFNGRQIAYTYDLDGRLTTKSYPDGSQVKYTYNAAGLRKTAQDARGVISYTYDQRNRLTRVTNPDGMVISYTYDARGNRTTVGVPSGTTEFAYDPLNRLSTVLDSQGRSTAYAYDKVGNRRSIQYPNGTFTQYEYNALNRLTRLENRSADQSFISSYAYTLGARGNRLNVTEHTGRRVDYQYDALYRLTREELADPAAGATSFAYAYDAVGNRLTRSVNDGPALSYTYDANDRLLTEGAASYTYDANGNVLTRSVGGQTTAFNWDFDNRLIGVNGPGQPVNYIYDSDGIRVGSTVGGVVTNYLVDKNRAHAQVLEERSGAGALNVSYVRGDDLISQRRGGVASFYHFDGLGSTRQLTNDAGAVTDAYTYEAFGDLLASAGTTPNNFLFAGEQYDPNVGFYYLRARHYAPSAGRFISADPFAGSIFEPASLHKYLYANVDPVNNTDPSGLMTMAEVSTVSNIIGNLASISFRIVNALDKVMTLVDVINAVVTVFNFAMNPTAVADLSSLFTNVGAGLPDITSGSFWSDEVAPTLRANMGRIAREVTINHPQKGLDILAMVKKPNSAFVIYMPTPPKPLPNPGGLIPTGIKLRGKSVKLYLGSGKRRGRLLGVGIIPNSGSQLNDLQIFRMDYHPVHGGSHPGDYAHWPDGRFHFHVPKP